MPEAGLLIHSDSDTTILAKEAVPDDLELEQIQHCQGSVHLNHWYCSFHLSQTSSTTSNTRTNSAMMLIMLMQYLHIHQ